MKRGSRGLWMRVPTSRQATRMTALALMTMLLVLGLPATALANPSGDGKPLPAVPHSDHLKNLFLDEDQFDQVSSGAQFALERRFGPRYAQVAPSGDSTVTSPLSPTDTSTLTNSPGADTSAQDTQSETTVALAGSNLISSFNDSGSFSSSTNHFTGWSSGPAAGAAFIDHGTLPSSTEGDAGDPVLAVDNTTGRTYLATLGFTTGNNIQVFRSDDSGATFGAPVNAPPGYGGTSAFQDKEWVAVDNFSGTGRGNVYLAWRKFNLSPAGIFFTRSTDAGSTFTPNQGLQLTSSGQGAFP